MLHNYLLTKLKKNRRIMKFFILGWVKIHNSDSGHGLLYIPKQVHVKAQSFFFLLFYLLLQYLWWVCWAFLAYSYACMYAGIKPTSTRRQLFREIVQSTWTVHSKEVSLVEFQVLDLQNETWNNEKVLFLMILISFVYIFNWKLWKSLLRKKYFWFFFKLL